MFSSSLSKFEDDEFKNFKGHCLVTKGFANYNSAVKNNISGCYDMVKLASSHLKSVLVNHMKSLSTSGGVVVFFATMERVADDEREWES